MKAYVLIGIGAWSFEIVMDVAALPHVGDSISPDSVPR